MRIAVVSDTHLPRGARTLPEACVQRLRAADLILHGGDFTGQAFLEELQERVVEVGGARIGMVHIPGPRVGREARLVARFPGCDAIVYGHTHVPQVDEHEGVWILNPGSPTERRSSPERTMLEIVVTGRNLAPALISLGT